MLEAKPDTISSLDSLSTPKVTNSELHEVFEAAVRNKDYEQILSLLKEGVSVATIELVKSRDSFEIEVGESSRWRTQQFKGVRNAEVSSEEREALEDFIQKASSGKVELNKELVNYVGNGSSFNSLIQPFERLTGIPLDEPQLVGNILEFYTKLGEKFKGKIL